MSDSFLPRHPAVDETSHGNTYEVPVTVDDDPAETVVVEAPMPGADVAENRHRGNLDASGELWKP